MRAIRTLVIVAVVTSLVAGGRGDALVGTCPPAADEAGTPRWPAPAEAGAFDVVHFGEGHWNEGQGPKTMPILVQEVVAHAPDLVTFSSDMADIGTSDRLECFRDIMQPVVDAGIHWWDSPGNHDREPVVGPGGVVNGTIDTWREVFAGMPRPWGDGPHPGAGYVVATDEPDDGPGASTHYFVDYGPPGDPALRLVVLDNSMHSLTASDTDQWPPVGAGRHDAGQLAFLYRTATEAQRLGLRTLVMMHEPTQDPRDVSNAHPISYNHTQNKGVTADNLAFDVLAAATGVDAVLLGHIQGNTRYAFGDVPYYVDGGGGGSPYAAREVGTDTGYFYGFRILRFSKGADGWTFRTYVVPLVESIEVRSPAAAAVGGEVAFQATAVQPHDGDLEGRFGLLNNDAIRLELRPPDPARVDAQAVPPLSYVWRTTTPDVLEPVPGDHDPVGDPAFDPATMTTSGRFRAVGPGTAAVEVLVGTRSAEAAVHVSP